MSLVAVVALTTAQLEDEGMVKLYLTHHQSRDERSSSKFSALTGSEVVSALSVSTYAAQNRQRDVPSSMMRYKRPALLMKTKLT